MDVWRLLIGAGGIYASFLYYGSLQEDVLAYVGLDGTMFRFCGLLMFLEAAVNVLFALILTMAVEGGPRRLPQIPYVVTGAFQVTAKYTTTAAMVHGVSFPVANLAKASKMLPVMLGSLVLGKAHYTTREYLSVGLIILGTVLVGGAKGNKASGSTSLIGVTFLLGSLACDGVVAGVQKGFKKTLSEAGLKQKNFEMQLFTNVYMCLAAALLTLLGGELVPGVAFCAANPAVCWLILRFALCSAVGQVFIFYTLSIFDPLVCTTVTTTRKVFSVLLSILFKGHRPNAQTWVGLAVASAGILSELAQNVHQRSNGHVIHGKAQ